MRPLILVTNDDGIVAPGIKALVNIAKDYGELLVVAPDSPQSAQGHAITINDPLRLRKVDVFDGIDAYECSGTPVDCVKLAKYVLLKDRRPTLCLSGINHGANSSINIIYSGTMSAAMEASIEGINSIGFSLCDYSFDANFAAAEAEIRHIIKTVLEKGLEGTRLLNVNIPKLPKSEIKGIKVCRQAEAQWEEDFKEGVDPQGRNYYWLKGKFVLNDDGEDTDIWAIDNGYVSVVPAMHDLTAHEALGHIAHLEQEKQAKA